MSAPDLALVAARAPALAALSPYCAIRTLPVAPQQQAFGTGVADRWGHTPGQTVWPMLPNAAGQWLMQRLAWDSDYFGTPTYRLFTGLFATETSAQDLQLAARQLRQQLAATGPFYAFGVVPATDTALLQALTGGGWRLVETRLNFHCPVAEATLPAPAPVRLAQPAEAAAIGRIAAAARNDFDRFHADPWFGPTRADTFLARYAEAAVAAGFADAVLVPAEAGLPLDSFLAVRDAAALAELPGSGFSRVLLTAVGPANQGWHLRLVAETVRRAAALSLPYVLMTTQATNQAVFRSCEKVGFRLGQVTHVLACHG